MGAGAGEAGGPEGAGGGAGAGLEILVRGHVPHMRQPIGVARWPQWGQIIRAI